MTKKQCEHEPTGEWEVDSKGESYATCKKCGRYKTTFDKLGKRDD